MWERPQQLDDSNLLLCHLIIKQALATSWKSKKYKTVEWDQAWNVPKFWANLLYISQTLSQMYEFSVLNGQAWLKLNMKLWICKFWQEQLFLLNLFYVDLSKTNQNIWPILYNFFYFLRNNSFFFYFFLSNKKNKNK